MARHDLTEHRKFKRLVRDVGGKALALGSLELIWHACYAAGDDYLGDATDVEIAADWQGEAGVLFNALLGAGGEGVAGFIEADPDRPGYRVHDLFDHAPPHVVRKVKAKIQRDEAGQTISDLRRAVGKRGQEARKRSASGQQTVDHLLPDGQQPASNESATVSKTPSREGMGGDGKGVTTLPTRAAVGDLALVPSPPPLDLAPVYEAYPRKEGKKRGMAILARVATSPAKRDAVLAAVRNYAAQHAGQERQYLKHFDSFMGCWEDYAQPTEPPRPATFNTASGFDPRYSKGTPEPESLL